MGRHRTLPDAQPRACLCCGSVFTPARKLWRSMHCGRRCAGITAAAKNLPKMQTAEARAKMAASKRGGGVGYVKVGGRHEHRIVAEQMLGRPLAAGEIVHHLDGNKKNNHPSNLEVLTQSEHCKAHDFGHHPGARRGQPERIIQS